MLDALQHSPFAAWGDISSGPLDPVKVTAARRLEIQYVEKESSVAEDIKKLGEGKRLEDN